MLDVCFFLSRLERSILLFTDGDPHINQPQFIDRGPGVPGFSGESDQANSPPHELMWG